MNLLVITGFRPLRVYTNKVRITTVKTIKRNNKLLEAANLPKMTVYNMRSLWAKFGGLVNDMEERGIALGVHLSGNDKCSRSFVFTDYSSISPPSSPVAHDSAHAPTHHTTYNQLYRSDYRAVVTLYIYVDFNAIISLILINLLPNPDPSLA